MLSAYRTLEMARPKPDSVTNAEAAAAVASADRQTIVGFTCDRVIPLAGAKAETSKRSIVVVEITAVNCGVSRCRCMISRCSYPTSVGGVYSFEHIAAVHSCHGVMLATEASLPTPDQG